MYSREAPHCTGETLVTDSQHKSCQNKWKARILVSYQIYLTTQIQNSWLFSFIIWYKPCILSPLELLSLNCHQIFVILSTQTALFECSLQFFLHRIYADKVITSFHQMLQFMAIRHGRKAQNCIKGQPKPPDIWILLLICNPWSFLH